MRSPTGRSPYLYSPAKSLSSSEKKLFSRSKKRTYNESACCRVDTPLFKRIATPFQYELFESLGIFPTGWRKVRVGFVGVLNERLPGL